MAAYRGKDGIWRYRKRVRLENGSSTRLTGTPRQNTKRAAEEAEYCAVVEALKSVEPRFEPRGSNTGSGRGNATSLASFVEQFLMLSKAENNKPSEIAAKESILEHYLVPELGHLPLSEIQTHILLEFRSKLLSKPGVNGKPLSNKSVNNILGVTRRLLSVAKDMNLISEIPKVPRIRIRKAEKPDIRFLTFKQADHLLETAREEFSDWALAVEMGLKTGLRLGELRALKWNDIDLEKAILTVNRSYWRDIERTPKSGKPRKIPLVSTLSTHLSSLPQRSERVLAVGSKEAPAGAWYYWRRKLMTAAGFPWAGWHTLRHTFASHLVMKGAPLKVVQELLGHATIEMTMVYAHLTPEVKRDAVELLG